MPDSPPVQPLEIPPGTLFAGDFSVEFKIGEGGMGAVYAVHQNSTGVRRALKVMGNGVLRDPRSWERFEREARICARIRSEHVVKVITAGIEERFHTPYLVMELLEGEPLEQRIRRGSVPASEARIILAQLCHGLVEMHALGIVHRDIKPENIFIARSHRVDVPFTVKLLDFGLAKTLTEGASSGVTQAVGTPRTMAPEQADPRLPITPATDVWALGLTAFHLLSGRSFWLSANHTDGTLQGLLAELLNLPIPPPSQRLAQLGLVVSLPAGFDDWLLRCLARDPAQRFRDAEEAWRSLAPILGEEAPAPPSSFGNTIPISSGPQASALTPAEMALAATAPPPSAGWTPSVPDRKVALAATAQVQETQRVPGVSQGGRRLRWVAGGAGVLIALGGAFLFWARERTTYCRELLQRRSDVACVGEIPEAQVPRRMVSYRLKRARGKARSAERVNGSGGLVGEEAGVAAWVYRYDAGGALAEVETFDEHRRLVVKMISQNGGKRFQVQGADGRPRLFPGAYFDAEELEFEEHGWVHRVRFSVGKGAPATDAYGAFGYDLGLDERGRISSKSTLGSDGKPSHNDRWIERLERSYSAQGDPVSERFLATGKTLRRSKDGCALIRQEHDAFGNTVRLLCHDNEDKPTLHNNGYSGWTARYDERGNRVEIRKINPDGVTVPDRFGVAIERVEHNEQGRPVGARYFAVDGSPTLNTQGVGGWRGRYDQRGDQIERTFLDASGAPVFARDGYATVRRRYDERHRPVELNYLDPTGAPTFHEDGYASVRLVYDEMDRVVEQSFFDTEGEPTLSNGRYATKRTVYDARGLPVEEWFLGLDGKPARNSQWVAGRRYRYDDRGNAIETAMLGPDEKPTRNKEGYSVVLRRFNERNEEVEQTFLDPERRPTYTNQGVAALRFRYDELGRVIERSNLDTSGRLAPDEDGEIQERFTLDDRGNTLQRSFFDAFGKPAVSHKQGFATENTRFNGLNFAEEISFLDASGKPAAGPSGAFVERSRHDERGNRIEQSFFDASGQPTLNQEGAAVLRWKYDAKGAVVEWAHLGIDGKLCRNKDGYALVRTALDPKGHQLEWTYLDPDGNLTRFRGYVRSLARYDLRGRQIESSYFDETGALTKPQDVGAPVVRFLHDARGNILEETFWEGDGRPASLPVARKVFSYNDRDLIVETRPFGSDGEPCRDHLVVRTRYDDRGRSIEFAFWDAAGKRATVPSGVSYEEISRDERGHASERRFFDAAGSLTIHKEKKAARLRYTYDDWGRKRGEECFDERGGLLRTNRFGERVPDHP